MIHDFYLPIIIAVLMTALFAFIGSCYTVVTSYGFV